MGAGHPPLAYLVAVEEALRCYADLDSRHTLGENALVSALSWKKVRVWRKSWPYITVIRHIRGKSTYNKWHDFLWADYKERNALHETFVKRHLPLSNGSDKHFRGELVNPKSWSVVMVKKTVRYKKKSGIKTEKPVPCPTLSLPSSMRFDKLTGELKEFVDLTADK